MFYNWYVTTKELKSQQELSKRLKMKERIKQIRLELGMSQGDFANEINVVQQQLSKYERGENKPSADFLIKLIEKINVNVNWLLTGKGTMFNVVSANFNRADAVEIKYYENPTLIETIKNPEITSIWIDRELVHNVWRKHESDLRIIQMPGDNMQGGHNYFTITNKDIVLIDMLSRNVSLSGIYAYTTQNEKYIFIKAIQRVADGSIKFWSTNSNYQSVILTQEQLDKIGFKVLGRVVKNLSFCFD